MSLFALGCGTTAGGTGGGAGGAAGGGSGGSGGGSTGGGTGGSTGGGTGGSTGGGTGGSTGGGTGGSGGGACSTQANTASVVNEVRVAAAQPQPMGGQIVDGTYHLTSFTINTGVGGQTGNTGTTRKVTFVVSGAGTGTYTLKAVSNKDNAGDVRYQASAVPSGNNLNVTFNCGMTGSNTLGFTVTAGGFQILDGPNNNVQTFTKQ